MAEYSIATDAIVPKHGNAVTIDRLKCKEIETDALTTGSFSVANLSTNSLTVGTGIGVTPTTLFRTSYLEFDLTGAFNTYDTFPLKVQLVQLNNMVFISVLNMHFQDATSTYKIVSKTSLPAVYLPYEDSFIPADVVDGGSRTFGMMQVYCNQTPPREGQDGRIFFATGQNSTFTNGTMTGFYAVSGCYMTSA